ncbi:Eukaryotic translation initiation factor isoform 4G-1 [Forsythia ovata]|uniref:Eukaryotic translation initiation factor isoform 4G-1 n=1 Tax=Forsythia ovata TaxID=205694 RepID=A0ABD1XBW2_9LAMI
MEMKAEAMKTLIGQGSEPTNDEGKERPRYIPEAVLEAKTKKAEQAAEKQIKLENDLGDENGGAGKTSEVKTTNPTTPYGFNQLLGQDTKSCPAEENVEAICQFFVTIGKQLDEKQKSKHINDVYFNRLKELSTNSQLAARLKFLIRGVLDLRANNWIPRREEVKAKTITEIHSEAEKNLGLRPGATASIRNSRPIASSAQGSISPGGFPMNRPSAGGMMPGMPGTRKMLGMPGMDSDNWEVPRSRSMPRGDGSTAQPAGRVQPTPFGKSPPLNQRFLPQDSGGFMSGRASAL